MAIIRVGCPGKLKQILESREVDIHATRES
jgi:hypothetical protein